MVDGMVTETNISEIVSVLKAKGEHVEASISNQGNGSGTVQ